MVVLAVSGGPDSMFMLNEYKKRKIVVAHVNYNTRPESKDDEELVRSFCKLNNIKFESTSVKFNGKGNFENWARNERYDFFKKIYLKHSCKKLLIAHHKDDSLETAIMQQRSGRNPKLFGIRKKLSRMNMDIYRPYVNTYWKSDIEHFLKKDDIDFNLDKTNSNPNYSTRNKIRKEITSWDDKKKNSMYSWFVMSNKILKKKNKKVEGLYKKWEEKDFSLLFYRNLVAYKNEVAYEFINRMFDGIKLSRGKLASFSSFINGEKGGVTFKLNTLNNVKKEKGRLLVK